MKLSSTFQKISRMLSIEFDELAKEIDHNQLSGESPARGCVAQPGLKYRA